jgi:hypothetical protein
MEIFDLADSSDAAPDRLYGVTCLQTYVRSTDVSENRNEMEFPSFFYYRLGRTWCNCSDV